MGFFRPPTRQICVHVLAKHTNNTATAVLCTCLHHSALSQRLSILHIVQGVQEKLCFFGTIHCNPSLAYIAVRDLQSSQRNASVQSLLLAGISFYNQQQPSAGEGEVANFREFLENNTIIIEQPVYDIAYRCTQLSKVLSV